MSNFRDIIDISEWQIGRSACVDITELVEKALSTGDCWDMVPETIQSFQEKTYVVSEK